MPPQSQPGSSFREQMEFSQWLIQFPALTVIVWLRPDIGVRILQPLALIAVTGFLLVISTVASPETQPVFLLLFAVISLLLGASQRVKRWRELNNGVRQHSRYLGTSPFEKLRWLPMFFRRHRRCARFLDPLACLLTGLALLPVSQLLAMWLLGSGICLRWFEYTVFQRERTRMLDLIDGLEISDRQTLVVEQFEPSPNPAAQQPAPGLPTGLGNDLTGKLKISSKHSKLKSNK